MNSRGQLDKLIVSLPVIIFVVVIMGIFIFLASALSVSRGIGAPAIAAVSVDSNVLFESVSIGERNYSIFEAVLLSGNKNLYSEGRSSREKEFRDAFVKAMREHVEREHQHQGSDVCLLLSYSNYNYFFFRNDQYDPDSKEQFLPAYRNKGALSRLSFLVDGKEQVLEYYFGGCIR